MPSESTRALRLLAWVSPDSRWGFALRDILSNFVSGILILGLRPFRVADQIVVGDTEGTVERIDLRATQIRTYDGRVVLVPNAELFTARVTNNTAAPVRRATVELALGYDVDLAVSTQVLLKACGTIQAVLADPPASVLVTELGPNDISVQVRFWTDSRRSDFVATRSAVRTALVDAMRRAGLGIPSPDRRVLVPGDPEQWRAVLRTSSGNSEPQRDP